MPPRVTSKVDIPPFQHLLDAYGRDVHRFLTATVGPDEVDDCYQETWLAALRAYPRLKDASNLRSWIFTVANHKAIDRLRAKRREPVAVAALPETAGSSLEEPEGELWAHVRELPPKQRMAIALRFVADAGYTDVAAIMGTSEAAARRSVHEGLKRLRMEYRR